MAVRSILPSLAFLALYGIGMAEPVSVQSPNGRLRMTVDVKDTDGATGCLVYRVDHRDRPIVVESRLGLALKDAPSLDGGFRIVGQQAASVDETWTPVYGERSRVRNHYRQVVVQLADGHQPARRLELICRAYDEGIAFCYSIPKQTGLGEFVIAAENSEFRFAANHRAWATYSAQGLYEAVGLDAVKRNCERPLTIEIEGGPYVALAEARLVDYARMRFQPLEGQPHAVVSQLSSEVKATSPLQSPWRVVMVADTPGGLLENNDIMLNLNDPCAIADTSWIKPGKVIRETSLTTAGGKACVDFAVKMGIGYVEYDAGWYGHEYDDASDATTVTRDPKRGPYSGPLDLHEVIRYGEQRGIGIIVYVNRRALERQLDEILPLYRQWGIKGVKYGFVNVGSQQWTTWLHEAVRKAADHQLMVDVHDEYRPTGYSRTYPNLMTVEGIHGNECMPPAENNVALPFTRFLCGPGDYTICWYTGRNKNSRAHQLGLAAVYYSPWQFVFWYDRPEQYRGEPELDFFKHVPAAWDDTRVVQGRIGEYITVARRHGSEWYVGSLNAVQRRTLDVPLSFLTPGQKYRAYVYADAKPDGSDAKAVSCEERIVDAATVLKADMAANGGQAVRLVPVQ
jgi:alpha-glucosidase